MTTYNLLILDKMIQHHYESREIICPTQEEVENALRDIRIELQDLKEENAELMVTLNAINNVLTGTHPANEFSLIEMVYKIKNITSTFIALNKIKGQMI